MTLTPPPETPTGVAEVPGRPRLVRAQRGARVAGVAAGIAQHTGVPVLAVRVAFVALSFANLLGLLIYLGLWAFLPAAETSSTPGLDAAVRTGRRETPRRVSGIRPDPGLLVSLLFLGIGTVWLASTFGFGIAQPLFWPLAFGIAGLGLVWRQVGEPERDRPLDRGWMTPFVARHGWIAGFRLVIGMCLVGVSVALVVANQIDLAILPSVLGTAAVLLLGVGLVAAPWLYRLQRNLTHAREQKIVSDARADMAAHLHDSVLQTLALIQRQSSDPRAVSTLARRQERELRSWLYGDAERAHTTIKAAFADAAAEVEDERGIPIEVVCVGDAAWHPDLEAILRASREAMMNAAKHSGADKVDVFVEVDPPVVEVFVRDRGAGFDMAKVEADRMGVTQSIIARMERHGGKARIRSAPGEGTEITLEMTYEPDTYPASSGIG